MSFKDRRFDSPPSERGRMDDSRGKIVESDERRRDPHAVLLERQPCPGIEIGSDERSRSGCARVSKKRSEKCLFDNKKRQKNQCIKSKESACMRVCLRGWMNEEGRMVPRWKRRWKVTRREEEESANALVCNSRPEESTVLLDKLEDEGRKLFFFLDNPLSSRRDETACDARIFFRKTELSGGWLGRTLETLEESISGTAQLHTHTDTPIYTYVHSATDGEATGRILHIQLIKPLENTNTRFCESRAENSGGHWTHIYLHTVHHVK